MQSLKKLADVPEPEMGAPLPMVLSDEYRLSICYNQAKASSYQNKIITNADIAGELDIVAILRFQGPSIWKFGDPDENGQPFHPLADLGLMDFYAFEVKNSNWAHRSMTGTFTNKHFIILFHDNTFEILAESYCVHSMKSEFVMDACQNEIDIWD